MRGFIDLHCDTLSVAWKKRILDIYDFPDAMVDLKRMQCAGMLGQFFAIFFPPKEKMIREGEISQTEDWKYFTEAREILIHTIDLHTDKICLAENISSFEKNRANNKISAFLTIEDGRMIDGSMERLYECWNMGVRLITLTWNYENCFGAPNSTDLQTMNKGLTAFGKEAVSVMNDLGILIDVSHLSDGGFYDVAELSNKPFVASHSNCRSLSPHSRNLTDPMIRIISEKGGTIGLNFCAGFLDPDIDAVKSTVDNMIAHIKHLVKVGGEECVSLGTDFDGISSELEIKNPEEMELLFDRLKKEGFHEKFIDRIAYQNVLKVLQEQ